jgi:diacylglycerol kinase family enzyme
VLKKRCDIVAVAGGDGTVGKVARCLFGSRTPIAVLPMGKANNVAKMLGLTGKPLADLIKGWKTAHCVNFDAGVAKGPWGSQWFIEGFGVGLFADTMARLDGQETLDEKHPDDSKKVIRTAVSILKNQIKNYPAKDMTVRLDGRDISGDYVLLEALNIRYIGPNLDLVPSADINDGFLDVVFVTKSERAKLSKYLSNRIDGKHSRVNLTVRQGRHLQIELKNAPIHIDDTAWPKDKDRMALRSNAIDIKIDPGALVFLVPMEKKRRAERRGVSRKM